MKPIFISYKRANAESVYKLVNIIQQKLGVECWIDIDSVETSKQFVSKICNAIDEAKVLLFMHSSAHSDIDWDEDYTIKELHYAKEKKKDIYVVKLDDTPFDNFFLFEFGAKNYRDSRDKYQFEKLLSELADKLKIPLMPADDKKEEDGSEFTLEMGIKYAQIYRRVYLNPDMSIQELRTLCDELSLPSEQFVMKYGSGTWSKGKYGLRLMHYPVHLKMGSVKVAYEMIKNPNLSIVEIKKIFDKAPSVLVNNYSRLHAECLQSVLQEYDIQTRVELM